MKLITQKSYDTFILKCKKDMDKLQNLSEKLDILINISFDNNMAKKLKQKYADVYKIGSIEYGYNQETFKQINNLIINCDKNIAYDKKHAFLLLKNNQVKFFGASYDMGLWYLSFITDKLNLSFRLYGTRKNQELIIVESFLNGNTIYQLSEDDYNILKGL